MKGFVITALTVAFGVVVYGKVTDVIDVIKHLVV